LGDGTIINRSSPVQIGTLTDWVSVYSGYLFTTAIRGNGTLWAWGRNAEGQLGNPTSLLPSSVPVQIGTYSKWIKSCSSISHTIAIRQE
jgi:alpha-tubulin suppressor-like RCC1 family protein